MWVEQAVFGSGKTRYGEGYHVMAYSPGLSKDAVVGLTHWSPSHASLQSTHADFSSLNYHPLPDDRLVISRSVYGGREFSGRGGLQVVTMALVVTPKQFLGYENHAFRLARVARAFGHLRWQPRFEEQLSTIQLPDIEESESLLQREGVLPRAKEISLALSPLRSGRRIAIVDREQRIVEEIVDQLDPKERLHCFFSTGLNASVRRPFRLQVFDKPSAQTIWRLESNSVQILKLAGSKNTTNVEFSPGLSAST